MDHHNGDATPRCFMLELPAEIRVMIYEELYQLQSLHNISLVIRKPSGKVNSRSTNITAITRVNQQIREEALPILYRGLKNIQIEIARRRDQRAVNQWLANVSDAVLQPVARVTFHLRKRCKCGIVIWLGDLKRPVATLGLGYGHNRCGDVVDECAEEAKDIVKRLVIVRKERRILTQVGLEDLIDSFCLEVAEQKAEAKKRRRKRRNNGL